MYCPALKCSGPALVSQENHKAVIDISCFSPSGWMRVERFSKSRMAISAVDSALWDLKEGAPAPVNGELRPDLSRPGMGIDFKHADAQRFLAA